MKSYSSCLTMDGEMQDTHESKEMQSPQKKWCAYSDTPSFLANSPLALKVGTAERVKALRVQ